MRTSFNGRPTSHFSAPGARVARTRPLSAALAIVPAVIRLLSAAVVFLAVTHGHAVAGAHGCVNDAKAALDAWSPKAFGPQATVKGPMSIVTIEREALTTIARCVDCPREPFGYQHAEWEQFKSLIKAGDCVVFFRSNPASWQGLYGVEGYALIRAGKVSRTLVTLVS